MFAKPNIIIDNHISRWTGVDHSCDLVHPSYDRESTYISSIYHMWLCPYLALKNKQDSVLVEIISTLKSVVIPVEEKFCNPDYKPFD